ncbi:MAG: hypothetical protein EXR86_05130 [Gammaproteobacteria bacterium]|nr:hypothetical protein [Gammaproteobacteria bacterium]
MHLGYLEQMRNTDLSTYRREFLKKAGASLLLAGLGTSAFAEEPVTRGFRGTGRMNMATGEDWIDTFFTGGAEQIVHYYADDFLFEDVTLFQTINNKEDLYRAFLPFVDAGPDSPAGVHQFDIIRYDGGLASDHRRVRRTEIPANYSPELWATWSTDALAGAEYDYDEWAVMNWVWKAKHNTDFLGLPAKGKVTHARGITFHSYKDRKIVREFTFWNFRHVAVQLGVLEPQQKFWLPPA